MQLHLAMVSVDNSQTWDEGWMLQPPQVKESVQQLRLAESGHGWYSQEVELEQTL